MERCTRPQAKLDPLRGRRVRGIGLSPDSTLLVFHVVSDSGDGEEARVIATATADCCSESWFHEMVNVQALLGHVVYDVRQLEESEAVGTRQEVDIVYGYSIYTVAGVCDIRFRNSSNGYYSGALEVQVIPEVEWVSGRRDSFDCLHPVLSDFSGIS